MNLTDRLKGAIARLERANQWYTIVEIHHEGGLVDDPDRSSAWGDGFNAGYAVGFEAGQRELKTKEDS